MIVYPPIEITDARLIASSVLEPDVANGEQAWQSGQAYAAGTAVIRASVHKRYQALVEIAAGDTSTPESSPLKWQDMGATNRWAMFERGRANATVGQAGESLVFRVKPGSRIDSVALVGMEASYATLRIYQGTTLQVERTISLTKRVVHNWFDYFFNDFTYQNDAIFSDLPMYEDAEIEVELVYGDVPPSLKALVVCRKVHLGKTMVEPTLSGANYSRIVRDQEYGDVSRIVQRRFVPTTRQKLLIEDSRDAEQIRDALIAIRSSPALFSGLDDDTNNPWFTSFLIYGLLKDWTLSAPGLRYGGLSLELEEL